MKRLFQDDGGTAVVEFVVLVVLVLVPVVYLVLGAMRVQAGAYAVTQAAREAGRAYVQADNPADGARAARMATNLALADQGFESRPDSVVVDCDGRCLAPGGQVSVQVNLKVRLPFLPDSLADSSVGSVRVSADHVVPVDEYRGAQ
ncbi:MAG: pilus assembly protein [Actinomycetota bacterium]